MEHIVGMVHTTPEKITERILKFCREKIDPTTKPVFLKLVPVENCRFGDCFGNAENYMRNNGGSVQYGWILWEIPNSFIEAEFHAVWVNNEGEYIDITPKLDGEKEILFLPDSQRKDKGGVTPNIIEYYIEKGLDKKIKIGRNEPCPCGSGKKYKKCCMNST